MYHSPLPLVGWAVLLGVLVLVWARGGPAERWGATLKFGTSLVALAAHQIFNQSSISTALLTADGLLAIGFLALAIRYASLWTGAAMLLQAGQFSLHAWYLVNGLDRDRFYAIANNLISIAILVCILVGVIIVWVRKARTAPAPQAG